MLYMFGQQFSALVSNVFFHIAYFFYDNTRKTELQNKMYSGLLNCEKTDILSAPPPKETKQESTKRKMYLRGRENSKLDRTLMNLINYILIFILFYVCVSVWGYAHMNIHAFKAGDISSLGDGLIWPLWVLVINPCVFLREQYEILTAKRLSSPQFIILVKYLISKNSMPIVSILIYFFLLW